MISEATKRNIFDELKIRGTIWFGRLDEVEFLSRIFNLEELPSEDARFNNMAGDIWQHRINNFDWDEWWITSDKRLNLLENDESFLNFLCQIIHPVVRNDDKEIKDLLDIFNSYLAPDGWKLVEVKRLSGKPIYAPVQFKGDFEFRNANEVSEKFAGEQRSDFNTKIISGDYDGAISSARSFIEGVFSDIYERITGDKLEESGGLPDKFKRIKNLLKLAPEQTSDKDLKSLCSNISGIIHALDQISNKMGDRHVPKSKAWEYHARFYVNACTILADFLYDRLKHQYRSKENLYEGLISALSEGHKRSLTREELLTDNVISVILEKCDEYIKVLLKDKFITDYSIGSFKENDIFFAAMRIFFNNLTKADIEKVFDKCKDNDQTLPPYGGLHRFLQLVKEEKPEFLTMEHTNFLTNTN